ncbi:winged helix-turn-helix domain-containing protein [Dactylosporangium vinaceum]|uniref:BTAD domain-containing putative transcriptional regulator n=1 Tax=Dactylosporangium vinaceum TaxID=53362 RepID=A0ABV5MP35_9ACTN|nr:BTAD domain-containing putative transcriptional regulator [Dactylosporangium vinaceum]UAB94486.1 winged helix-turn-helix domain-containing protein [Dactylosporangium vinaceum]
MLATPDGPELPRFELLGPVRAWQGETELDLGPAKQRAVLTTLLIHANRPVPTERIVDAVWQADPPENGANVVQKYVAGLRRVLEPGRSPRTPGSLLTLTDAGYQLSVGPDRLDAELFQQYVQRARAAQTAGRPGDASRLLEQALGLWRGPALAGLTGALFDAARDRLTESRAAALEHWAALELLLGHQIQLAPRLAELVAEFPLREELRYIQMLALYRCGRQPEALAVFRDARRLLAEEFGVEPSERLQELHRGILRADPALVPPRPPWPPAPVAYPQAPVAYPQAPVAYPQAPYPPPPVPLVVPLAVATPTTGPPGLIPLWLKRTAAIAVPLLTFGLTSWAVVGFVAVRHRSRGLGFVAAGLLGLLIFFCVGMELDGPGEEAGTWAGFAVLALLLAMLGGATAGALIRPRPTGPTWEASAVFAMGQRIRRDQARQLVKHHPAIARELQIGRPDLPRTFDDGGLVDVNTAPEIVIASLPGIGPDVARRILADRYDRGGVTSVDELVARNLLPRPVARALEETLVAVPPPLTSRPDSTG